MASFGRIATVLFLAGFFTVVVHPSEHAVNASSTDSSSNTVPVLLELFTSEGCSSCPPADALLKRLDQAQPLPGTKIIGLSEHVDYWNHDGWRDPFSSSEFTDRQNRYANSFQLRSIYTPQMVVDGKAEVTGSDAAGVQGAILRAREAQKVPVMFSALRKNSGGEVSFHLETGAVPSGQAPKSMDLVVVVASAEAESKVDAGENGGKTLHHVNVVRSLKKIASIQRGDAFARDVTVKVPGGTGHDFLLVAFLQDSGTGRVWGAASESMAN